MYRIRFARAVVFAALAVAMMLPVSAAARTRVGVGVGFFGGPYYPYYPYYYGPWAYPYPYYGFYGPYPYAPYGYYGRPVGEVRIKSPDPNAMIYINGAYAGRAHDLKRIYLAPGTYDIEQRIGPDIQHERVYVLANRSVKLEFERPGPHTSRNDVPPPPAVNQQPAPPAPVQSNSSPVPASQVQIQ